jgi:hypothetical protein
VNKQIRQTREAKGVATPRSPSTASIDALLARLDKRIAAENAAMDDLLKRLAAARPKS